MFKQAPVLSEEIIGVGLAEFCVEFCLVGLFVSCALLVRTRLDIFPAHELEFMSKRTNPNSMVGVAAYLFILVELFACSLKLFVACL